MPSHTFQLVRPENSDALPQYTREPKLPAYLQAQDGATEKQDRMQHKSHTDIDMTDGEHFAMAKMLEDVTTRIPQALLVDAATSLCAYLYFTTLQARLLLQQQASLDLLSSLCASFTAGADASMLHTCAHAISHQADSASSLVSSFSHRYAIALVVAKALCGYGLLSRLPHVVRPFDYLVVSGTFHCLVLYLVFFMPVASLVPLTNLAEGSLWARVTCKILCLVAVCCSIALAQWLFQIMRRQLSKMSDAAREGPLRRRPAIALP